MSAPVSPTDPVFPDWTNLVDRWREEDAEWLRNRVVHIFASAAERTGVLTAGVLFQGLLSYLRDTGRLEVWNGTAWEGANTRSAVAADVTDGTLIRHQEAGTGLTLRRNGGVDAGGSFTAGPGVLGVTPAGVTVRTGERTARLSTNATALQVDSPVAVTGSVVASGGFQGNLTGDVAAGVVSASTGVSAAALAVSGEASVGSPLTVGNKARILGSGAQAEFVNVNAPGAFLRVSDAGAVSIGGALTVVSTATFQSAVTAAQIDMAHTSRITQAGKTPAQVAGVVVSTSPASGNYPNGTIWFQTP